MRAFVAVLVIGCLLVTNAYGLTPETKDRLIDIYNRCVHLYSLIVGLLDDLSNEKITRDLAENKIDEWKMRYEKEAGPVPREAEKMCDLMNKMIDTARATAHDYQPNNQRTIDMLNELDEVKGELKKEMTALKYSLQ
jgi:hypothetical protein